MAEPLTDGDLPGVYASLGLPGVADIHVHFMPDQVLRKVWAYFDAVPGDRWQVRYRFDEAERVRILGELGVLAHTALLYPHKPGMAAWLNDWGVDFAARTPGCVATGTFYPESDVDTYVGGRAAPGRPGVQGPPAGRRLRPARPAARPGVGHARRRPYPGGLPLRQLAGTGAVHRTGSDRRGPRPPPGPHAGDRPLWIAGVRASSSIWRSAIRTSTWTRR